MNKLVRNILSRFELFSFETKGLETEKEYTQALCKNASKMSYHSF